MVDDRLGSRLFDGDDLFHDSTTSATSFEDVLYASGPTHRIDLVWLGLLADIKLHEINFLLFQGVLPNH